jgi:hypothetical protein
LTWTPNTIPTADSFLDPALTPANAPSLCHVRHAMSLKRAARAIRLQGGLSCRGERLMLGIQILLETGRCPFGFSVTDVLTLLRKGAHLSLETERVHSLGRPSSPISAHKFRFLPCSSFTRPVYICDSASSRRTRVVHHEKCVSPCRRSTHHPQAPALRVRMSLLTPSLAVPISHASMYKITI